MSDSDQRPHVVIVGGGFAGLTAAKELGGTPFRVTVVDRTNHHLFQPLLYQVASAGLAPGDIASPIRGVVRNYTNVSVLLDEALDVDFDKKVLRCRNSELSYDYLLLASGTTNNYFGHPEWEKHAPGLKTVDDALELRRRVLLAFESAEREKDVDKRRGLLTFVVVGGGPTGVEMAGAFSELARHVLARDFRSIRPELARVVLVEGGDRILASFPEDLSQSAVAQLQSLGVEVRLKTRVTAIDEKSITLGSERVEASVMVWAAGTKCTPLNSAIDVPKDKMGRLIVEKDWSLPGHPEVFALGDMAHYKHDPSTPDQPLPGLSPVAMQGARYVTDLLLRKQAGRSAPAPFRYWDKGTMATIGRSRAVAQASGMKFTGLMAWLAWLVVHIWYLIGFRNRFVVMFNWAWSYFTYGRGSRLITGYRVGDEKNSQ